MPAKNHDLHGSAPDQNPVALILIDMINDFEFDGGERAVPDAVAAAHAIFELKRRAKARGIPVIYANDNFGRWRSDFRGVVEHCLHDGVRGAPVAAILEPEEDDYFVLKPKHSAFYSTSLDILLNYLGATTLILTGISGDICVRFTANDAYMRDYRIVVPEDCVVSLAEDENAQALDYLRRVLRAEILPAADIDLDALIGGSRPAERESA